MANYGDLSLLEQARAPAGNRGAAELGAVLGGGGARRAQMYNQGALSGANLAEVLAKARQRQQAEVGRQSLQHSYREQGKNDLADMIATMDHVNPNEVADYNSKEQKTGFSKQAFDNATGPNHDDNMLNRMLSVIEGKPQTLTKIEGDTVLNPMVTPDQQHLTTTDLGKAAIGEKGAQAESAHTASLLHMAEAASANALADNRRSEGSAKKPVPLTSAAEKIFNSPVNDDAGAQKMDSQGRPVFATDVNKMKDFQRFIGERSPTDPKLLNQNAALPKYLSEYGAQNDNAPPGSFSLQDMAQDASAPATPAAPPPPGKAVVKQVKKNGRLVNVYADGSGDYAD